MAIDSLKIMLEILSSIIEVVIAHFPPDEGNDLPATTQQKIHSWNTFINYLDNLELQKNWRKYEEQGFRKCAVFDADGTIWRGDLSRVMIDRLAAGRNISKQTA